MSKQLVVPTNIPWPSLKQAELEECLYWLLDELGAKDLEWRKGGTGGGANDQGRDLEATFHIVSPDNEIDRQRWWIESKGRAKTVEPSAVKEAVMNAQDQNDIAVLVIATNTQFSNPTRDWIKNWQTKHPRPSVRLWERTDLERMLVKHPSVAVRLFSAALSTEGRIEAIRSRFWNQCHLPSECELQRAWAERVGITISPEAALALVVGEVANGCLAKRPWMMTLDDDELRNALALTIGNSVHLLTRAERIGTNVAPILSAISNVLMTCLIRFPGEKAWNIIRGMWSILDDAPPPKWQQAALTVAVEQMRLELAEVCSDDCERVTYSAEVFTPDERHDYWRRFKPPREVGHDTIAKDHVSLVIEKQRGRCTIGLALDDKTYCPLVNHGRATRVSKRSLQTFQSILSKRVAQSDPE